MSKQLAAGGDAGKNGNFACVIQRSLDVVFFQLSDVFPSWRRRTSDGPILTYALLTPGGFYGAVYLSTNEDGVHGTADELN